MPNELKKSDCYRDCYWRRHTCYEDGKIVSKDAYKPEDVHCYCFRENRFQKEKPQGYLEDDFKCEWYRSYKEDFERVLRQLPNPQKWVFKEPEDILPVRQCANCEARFSLHKNQKGEMVAIEHEPYDAWICGCYDGVGMGPWKAEDKPAELFVEEGKYKCPLFKPLIDKMIKWAEHVPNYYNDGELTVIDDKE